MRIKIKILFVIINICLINTIFTFGQIPEEYADLERVFNNKNKLDLEGVPKHYLDSINSTLKNTTLVYKKNFFPNDYESREVIKYQFDIDDNKLNVIIKNDTLNYRIDSYFSEQKDLFTGDFNLFVESNGTWRNIGYLTIYYIDDKCTILKETIYVNKKFLFLKWKSSEVRSVLLLEL